MNDSMGRTKDINLHGEDGKLWKAVKEKYEEKLGVDLTDPNFERKMLELFVEEENLEVDLSEYEK